MSRMYEEAREREQDESIAQALGLSLDDYYGSGVEITTSESDDGVIYDCLAVFPKDTPEEILTQVQGLNRQTMSVSFGPSPPWDQDDSDEDYRD